MRRNSVFLLLFFFVVAGTLPAQELLRDTLPFSRRFIHRIGVEGRTDYIFPTQSFMKGDGAAYLPIDNLSSLHLRYSFQLRPNTEAARAYCDAWQGIGVAHFRVRNGNQADVPNPEAIGNPSAIYLFQGGHIARLAPRLTLDYEWNFGLSFGWKPFNEFDNPGNTIIGSKVNAYMNAGFGVNWALLPCLDLQVGISGTHFSNGNTQYPNAGLNSVGGRVALVYNFNRTMAEWRQSGRRPMLPTFTRNLSYDLTLFGSWRQKAVDVENGQIPSPDKYAVAGICFAPMYEIGYKFRAGVSLDAAYDASNGVRALYDASSYTTEDFSSPPFRKQVSLGVSARAEWVMPYFSINLGLGTNILHDGQDTKAFYQILALKVAVSQRSYLHIGYNLKNFHDPNYLMLGIGRKFR